MLPQASTSTSMSMNAALRSGHEPKRRKVQRACDVCRLKRVLVRCDGEGMSGKACNHCVRFGYECKYAQATKTSKADKAYVQSLENRLEKMEALMKQLAPNVDMPALTPSEASPFVSDSTHEGSRHSSAPRIMVDDDDVGSSDDEFVVHRTLEERFKQTSFHGDERHFFGKSSSMMFLTQAIDIRDQYSEGATSHNADPPRFLKWKDEHPWVRELLKKPVFTFPPLDLIPTLVDLYFVWFNLNTPLLHRPTFDKSVSDGLHLRDEGFAIILLLVCALGARSCQDPRVYIEGYDDRDCTGWKWFHQAQSAFKLVNYGSPRLYDIQAVCLLAHFMHVSSAPLSSWPVIAVGLRLAQALGAHRRRRYDGPPTVEKELLKRAFWALVLQDRGLSSALGRPSAIQDEDFDVDLPLECDDEYWLNDNPELAFKQPPDKPSTIARFNCAIRLEQIHAFALRTIYSIDKSRTRPCFTTLEWEEKTVAEIDSALNKFIDSIPEHLRWDPHRLDMHFLNQSASLYASYYNIQITVHRQFIPSPRKQTQSSLPSLAICTNAARSCIHITDVQHQRSHEDSVPEEFRNVILPINGLFNSGMILMLNIWTSKRSNPSYNPARDLAYVHKALDLLKETQARLYSAGKLRQALSWFASVGEMSLPPSLGHKRLRDQESQGDIYAEAMTTQDIGDNGTDVGGSTGYAQARHYLVNNDIQGHLAGPTPSYIPPASNQYGQLPSYLQSASQTTLRTTAGETNTSSLLTLPAVGVPYIPPIAPEGAVRSEAIQAGDMRSGYRDQATDYPAPPPAPVTVHETVFPGPHAVNLAHSQDPLDIWSNVAFDFEWGNWANYLEFGEFCDAESREQ